MSASEGLRLLAEACGDHGQVTLTAEGIISSWNASSVLGWTEEELLGQGWEVLFRVEDREAELPRRSLLERVVVDRWHLHKDGRPIYLKCVLAPSDDGFVVLMRDLRGASPAEWQQAEVARRESEQKYSTLFNSIDEGFAIMEVVYDAQGHPCDLQFIETNPRFEQLVAIDVVGKFARTLFPGVEEAWFHTYHEVLRTDQSTRFQEYFAPMDAWYEVFASPAGISEKNRVAVVFNDITERRRYESTLAMLAEISRDLEWPATLDQAMAVLGSKVGEFLRSTLVSFSSVGENAEQVNVLRLWRKREEDVDHSGQHILSDYTDGSTLPDLLAGHRIVVHNVDTDPSITHPERFQALGISSYVIAPILKAGKLVFQVAVCDSEPRTWRDDEVELILEVTARVWARVERDQADEELRRSEERSRLVLQNLRDHALFTLDSEGVIVRIDGGGLGSFGYTTEEVLGTPFHRFFTLEEQARGIPDQVFEQVRATGRSETEGWRLGKDGRQLWANEIVTSIIDHAGVEGFVAIVRDRTERRENEYARLHKEKETTLLAERNRMAQELHDSLAQGFTVIKLHTELAEEALEESPPDIAGATLHLSRAREYSRVSQSEARRSIRELRSPLLDSVSLSQALQQLANAMSDGVKVSFDCQGEPEAIPMLMKNDIYRIGQEAITNAVRHAQAGKVEVLLDLEGDQIQLDVADDGRGFDKNTYQAGFGITGMKERAHRIGAELLVDSSVGRGTTLSLKVSLPRGPMPPGGEETRW